MTVFDDWPNWREQEPSCRADGDEPFYRMRAFRTRDAHQPLALPERLVCVFDMFEICRCLCRLRMQHFEVDGFAFDSLCLSFCVCVSVVADRQLLSTELDRTGRSSTQEQRRRTGGAKSFRFVLSLSL
jgi:hypothetical protein